MIILTLKADIQHEISKAKNKGKSIGFVPTMGALHEGHLSLVKQSLKETDLTVVSIFVNPTQFNNPNDLCKYPRTLEKDVALLQTVGDILVFAPTVEEMYDQKEVKQPFSFDFGGLDTVMEGRFRPGHFNGVVQVVSKLFNIVTPDKAYFGEKDFQQLAIIRRMVALMNYPIEIVGCPIVREANGLAMSSRNQHLTEREHKNAVNISRILKESRNFADRKSVTELTQWVTEQLNAVEYLEVEYFEIVNGDTLRAISDWNDSAYVVGCITVYCGETRLIDNIQYK
jgi:pantoate--beta-alanine ligase